MNKPTVFISYSHKDKRWLEELQTHLKPFVRNEKIALWDDKQIDPGAQWQEEIAQALQSAQSAVLLVSPDFLASDFIAEKELPPLLDAAKQRGLTIYWIAVSTSAYEQAGIDRYQCANNPARPLDKLSKPQKQRPGYQTWSPPGPMTPFERLSSGRVAFLVLAGVAVVGAGVWFAFKAGRKRRRR